MRGPLMKAEQDSSITIQDLTPVFMARRRFGLTEKGLVPLKAFGNVSDPDNRPCPFHERAIAMSSRVVSPST